MYSYSSNLLMWPETTGYQTYTGGFDETDDGSAIESITIPDFAMNGTVYNTLWFSTNGSITFDAGTSQYDGYPSVETQICANNDDMELDPDTPIYLTDGDAHAVYYYIGTNYTKIICHQGYHGDEEVVGSWMLNIYRDSNYQWIETRLKVANENEIYAGPYNDPDPDVYELVSTNSQVWRGDLFGQNWEYMGQGSVISSETNSCSDLVCPTVAFKCLRTNKTCTCAKWKFFTAQCTRNQQALGLCSGTSGAYVPAITVCNQRLF